MSKDISSKGFSVLAAVALSLSVTPLLIGAGNVLATTARAAAPALRTNIVPIAAVHAAPEPCLRKVRVVYIGYGGGAACGQTR